MSATPVWRARTDKAGTLTIERRADFDRYVAYTLADRQLDVIVRPHKSQRSNQQSRWERKAVRIIADGLGWDRHQCDRLHYALLTAWCGSTLCPVTGASIPNILHSSTLKTHEFADWQSWMIRWAMVEHQIHVPMGDEMDLEEVA